MGDVDLAGQINQRLRKEVFRRYALVRNGKLMFCRHAHGKIVYPDMESAVAAGAELQRLGSPPQSAYECSGRDHYHLYRDVPRLRLRRNRGS